MYASWCSDSPTDQGQPTTISKWDLGFTQLASNWAKWLPTIFQPKSQIKASRRCSQASVEQCINMSPCQRVGRTPEAGVYWGRMAIQAVESDSSLSTWMGLSFEKHTIISFYQKQTISVKFRKINSLSIKKHFNKLGERADCTLAQNILSGLRKPVKLFSKCISTQK